MKEQKYICPKTECRHQEYCTHFEPHKYNWHCDHVERCPECDKLPIDEFKEEDFAL